MRRYRILLLSALLAFLLATGGCGITRSALEPGDVDLEGPKKRVLVLPLIDTAGLTSLQLSKIESELLGRLRAYPHLRLYPSSDKIRPSDSDRIPQIACGTHPEVLEKAEARGMNAVLAGVITPVNRRTEKTGIWPFRGTEIHHEISLILNLMDVRSQALCLSHQETGKLVTEAEEGTHLEEAQVIARLMDEAVPRIIGRQAARVAEALQGAPWFGKILAVESNSITINAGQDVAARAGQVFSVFSGEECIECRAGRTLRLLGDEIGEIRIRSVKSECAVAEPVSGGGFRKGQPIRFVP